MPLKLYVKSLEGLDENAQKFYVEKKDANGEPDGFKLDVEGGAEPSDRLTQFRTKLNDLEAKIQAFGDWTPEKIKQLEQAKLDAEEKALENAKKGKVDVEETIKPIKQKYEEDLSKTKERIEFLEKEIERRDIDNEASRVLLSAGVYPEAVIDGLSRIRSVFKMDDGRVKAFDETGHPLIDPDTGEGYTIEGYSKKVLVKKAPFLFVKEQGGGSPGNKGKDHGKVANPWKEGDSFNLTEQGSILKEDPQMAERLMKEAKYAPARIDRILGR